MLAVLSDLTVPGRGAARLAAATLVSTLAATMVMSGAGRAAAEGTGQRPGGATATMDGLKTYGGAVLHGDDGDREVPAGLFEMSVEGGGMLQTYCVDVLNPTQKDAKYQETPWSGTSLGTNKDAGRVRWILRNSYPQVDDLAALAKKAGVKDGLTRQDAAAGTQVAIWRYSDHADVTAVDPGAERLADYLEKNARPVAEPAASLTLDPSSLSGHPGERIGPVTVRTNAGRATVSPPADAATSGVRIVDRKGEEVTDVTDGGRIYFDVPEDAPAGTAALTVQASTTVPVGRAFASESRSQTQILAGSSESTVSATAGATWADQGPIPALSAAKNCAEGSLDITAGNAGDETFAFDLLGSGHRLAPGETRTIAVPLQEDQPYDLTVHGPDGSAHRFTGILDCRTESDTLADVTTQTVTEPTPLTAGGTASEANLAETGTSDLTPFLTATALTLLTVGGTTLYVLRRRNPTTEN
ncbi:Cys-Gln thioester bond-forming surface protein [Streptomyces fumanus]|uniref:TQXA domain-containing protein n=1 Tax=Streptomyces fumanus TaxID=67302 RepID=A0A919A2Q5_9ACTN|nr:Cys-Gln thioester bond-forming surface protein [Streptomyces fumanus]GHE84712.1 TQXA domain-containing protein [Streptomyces fumanus]